VALLRARSALSNLKGDNHDQESGIKIVLRALEEPLRCIVANAGEEPSVVLDKVVQGKGNFGYNAQTGEYGDLVEMGVVDPTKVTRAALQNAASVAGLILTTDAMVAESPQEESSWGWHGRWWWMGGMAAWVAWECNRHKRQPLPTCRTQFGIRLREKAPFTRGFFWFGPCPRDAGRCIRDGCTVSERREP
jgi:hypothetical protein